MLLCEMGKFCLFGRIYKGYRGLEKNKLYFSVCSCLDLDRTALLLDIECMFCAVVYGLWVAASSKDSL